MYFEYGLDLIQVWFKYVGNPADRVATPAPPPYGQQDKLKNAHTQNLCGETVVIVAWSFWPWKSEGDGAKKLRTSSGALRKPEAEPSPRLCDQLPSKHPSRGGPHYWPRQLKPLLQPVSRCKTRQPTPAQMAKTSPWAPSSSIAPPPPAPGIPPPSTTLRGHPWHWTYAKIQVARHLVSGSCACDSGPPFRPSCGKKERPEKKKTTNEKQGLGPLFAGGWPGQHVLAHELGGAGMWPLHCWICLRFLWPTQWAGIFAHGPAWFGYGVRIFQYFVDMFKTWFR